MANAISQRGGGTRKTRLTAIIACYRDAPAVPIMYQRLVDTFTRIGVEYEIIFVNDASPDDAGVVLAALASRDPRVMVINHSRNFGSQNAFTSGMRLATGDAVVLLDGDLQDPPELIEAFWKRWLEGYEVVYGVRTTRQAPRILKVAYKAFYRLFRASSYVPMPLDAGDFSLLDRKVVNALNALPENNRFLRGLRAWVGFRQVGVGYSRPERMFGTSTNSWRSNLGWARKAILSFSYAPLDLITVLAILTVIASLLGIVASIVIRLARPDMVPSGFTTVIVVVLFIGGIQLTCLSIIGSYLAHIYDEVKRRPAFIVDSVLNAPSDAANTGGPTPAAMNGHAEAGL